VITKSSEDSLWTARHEAGHAVLIGSHCHDVEWVSIDPRQIGDADIGGRTLLRRYTCADDLKSRWDFHTRGDYSSLNSKAAKFLQEGGGESWRERSLSDVRREVEVEAIGRLAGPAVDYVRLGGFAGYDIDSFLRDDMDLDGTPPTDIVETQTFIAVLEAEHDLQEVMLFRFLDKAVRLVQRCDLWPIILGLADRLGNKGTIRGEELYEYLDHSGCPNPFQQRKANGRRP
jgi:hypothetical protein